MSEAEERILKSFRILSTECKGKLFVLVVVTFRMNVNWLTKLIKKLIESKKIIIFVFYNSIFI